MSQPKKRKTTLGRESAHRLAVLRNISNELVEHEMIKTTLAKAKVMRRFIEPLITRAKEDTLANRRVVFNRLRNRAAVTKLFNEIAPRCKQRPGGYTRILKCGSRMNDNAAMAVIELVDRVQMDEDSEN